MSNYNIPNPYAKGILKLAPIKVSIDEINLSAYNIQEIDLLEPLKDIVDICGVNPQAITSSINTLSSESSGRDISLNMHRDILGRVRDINIRFPIMSGDKFKKLKEYLLDKYEEIEIEEVNTDGPEPETNQVIKKEYIIFWLVELLTPEREEPVREVCYLGDSSFSDVEIDYQTTVTNVTSDNRIVSYYNEIKTTLAKNTNINLIGKTKIELQGD